MKTRFFAFGCSFTLYSTPTWADFIGINFDEYYNFAVSGGSNTLILYNFIKALDKYKFNKEQDYIAIMFTSHGRYSYFLNEWTTHGDVLLGYHHTNDEKYAYFRKNLWSKDFGVLQSWVAVKTIKEFLITYGIKHKFVLMDRDENTFNNVNYYLKSFWELTSDGPTMTDFRVTSYTGGIEWIQEDNITIPDGHPSIETHYKYFKQVFSEFDTEKSNMFFQEQQDLYLKGRNNQQTYSNKICNIMTEKYKRITLNTGIL